MPSPAGCGRTDADFPHRAVRSTALQPFPRFHREPVFQENLMTKLSRSTLAFAFVASLAAPLAFAQAASTDVGTDAAAQAAPTQPLAHPPATPPPASTGNTA